MLLLQNLSLRRGDSISRGRRLRSHHLFTLVFDVRISDLTLLHVEELRVLVFDLARGLAREEGLADLLGVGIDQQFLAEGGADALLDELEVVDVALEVPQVLGVLGVQPLLLRELRDGEVSATQLRLGPSIGK